MERIIREARDCLDSTGGNWDAAAAELVKRAKADPALRDAGLEYAARAAVREATRSLRASLTGSPTPRPGPGATSSGAGLRSLARRNAQRLLDFPLPGGCRLGSAVYSEVAEAHAHYARNRRGNAIGEAWTAAIMRKLPKDDTKPVESVFSEESLRRARNRAEQANP